ncbi:MAG: Uma2 family endonuclease [Cyanobacteria bacterium SBLK]|nr:Uma2 family endonuclease [Cyanobacteria bacterium SBLK]
MLEVTRKRFTIDDYHRLGDLGFFAESDRLELIRGEIIQMPNKKPPHSVANSRLVKRLILMLGEQAIVRGQEPVILPSDSEPLPDVAILKARQNEYLDSHPYPQDIILLIEISETTLKYDRETKLSLYAEDGIADYWIVNLVDNYLEVYSEPYQNQTGEFSYRSRRIFLPNETVALPSFPDLLLDLSTIFPQSPDSIDS